MKKFNDTGTCIPERNYMVDTAKKLNSILKKIEEEEYFIINKPRQYGKTTTLYMLERKLEENDDYLVISISFEGIGDLIFEYEKTFSKEFLQILADSLSFKHEDFSKFLEVENLKDLSKGITNFIVKTHKKVILMIDEVDKSSNNQLFISFLGMLRSKYLLRNAGKDKTFDSVILAGVHDVKSLKMQIRPDDEHKFNSPWNIASDFDIDMSFSAEEIKTMLKEYKAETNIELDENYFSDKLYFYTSGYPFLVSKLCKIIDEKIIKDEHKVWHEEYMDKAVKLLLKDSNTNFDSLIKNIENNKELYDFVKKIILDGQEISYVKTDEIINLATIYGVIRNSNEICKIHNKIYQQIIYNHMTIRLITKNSYSDMHNYKENFIKADGKLDVEKILIKFKDFMKHEASKKRENFLEHDCRVVFLAFLNPIINGTGFAFKEVQGGNEKRFDVVITYAEEMHIIEMKIWHGEEYNKKGEEQLNQYLEQYNLDRGYLLVFDFRKRKRQVEPRVREIYGKRIFEVVVN
jgi:hypothetical protein